MISCIWALKLHSGTVPKAWRLFFLGAEDWGILLAAAEFWLELRAQSSRPAAAGIRGDWERLKRAVKLAIASHRDPHPSCLCSLAQNVPPGASVQLFVGSAQPR